jgi:hypothetical protein
MIKGCDKAKSWAIFFKISEKIIKVEPMIIEAKIKDDRAGGSKMKVKNRIM